MENLKKTKEFQKIYKKGKKVFGNYTLIFYDMNKENIKRCGFVVSKKVGNAVVRNRLKRLFREYYREKEKNFLSNIDLIFVAKKKAGENIKKIKYINIKKDLNYVFATNKLFK